MHSCHAKESLILKNCNADTIFWKKILKNVCIFYTFDISELSNVRPQVTATLAKCSLHK